MKMMMLAMENKQRVGNQVVKVTDNWCEHDRQVEKIYPVTHSVYKSGRLQYKEVLRYG